MYTSLALIVLSTLGALISIWEDDLVAVRKRKKIKWDNKEAKLQKAEEEEKDRKSRKVKIISTIFILIVLALSGFQIIGSELEKEDAETSADIEKQKQRTADSTAYALLEENNRNTIRAYESQLRAAGIMTTLQNKSDSIVSDLSTVGSNVKQYDSKVRNSLAAVDTSLKNYESNVKRSTDVVSQSMSKLEQAANRLLYPLEDDIHVNFRLTIIDSNIINRMQGIKSTFETPASGKFLPFFDSMKSIVRQMKFKIYFSRRDDEMEEPLTVESSPGSYKFIEDSYKEQTDKENSILLSYDTHEKKFYISCRNMRLGIINKAPKMISILDLDSIRLNVSLDFSDPQPKFPGLLTFKTADLWLGFNFSGLLRGGVPANRITRRYNYSFSSLMGPLKLQSISATAP